MFKGGIASFIYPLVRTAPPNPANLSGKDLCCLTHYLRHRVGRVTPCAPQTGTGAPNGADRVTRPTCRVYYVSKSFCPRTRAGSLADRVSQPSPCEGP